VGSARGLSRRSCSLSFKFSKLPRSPAFVDESISLRSSKVALSDFNGKQVEWHFTLSDIATLRVDPQIINVFFCFLRLGVHLTSTESRVSPTLVSSPKSANDKVYCCDVSYKKPDRHWDIYHMGTLRIVGSNYL